jgi:AcrR family transcriptional regulator
MMTDQGKEDGPNMQVRADRTRRAILKAAAETFEAHGYLGTSLQDVVAGRHVSKGALYFHFPSKEELASAIIIEQHDLLSELISELRERHPRAIRLLLAVSRRTASLLSHDVMVRASTRLACEQEHIGGSAPPLLDSWTDAIERLLDEAKAQGDLLADVDTRIAAEFVIVAFTGLQHRRYFSKTDAASYPPVAVMWRLLLPGLVTAECLSEIRDEVDATVCDTAQS